MKSIQLFFCIFTLLTCLQAQVEDDFSDGELLSNPSWEGDVEKFTINDQGQLQLLAKEAGSAKIFTTLGSTELFVWQIDVIMDFAPSASNRLQILLWTDHDSLPLASGYGIQLGESGTDDRLELIKIVDGSFIELARGTNSFDSDPNFTLRVKLKDNLWTVESQKDGDPIFQNEIMHVEDQLLPRSADDLFVIAPTFTSTRLDKFLFDNITISAQEKVDTSAPKLDGITVQDETSISLVFSEPIDSTTAESVENYLLEPSGLHPSSANLLSDHITVELIFSSPLLTNQNYILVVSNISDLNGNHAVSQWEFTYEQPRTLNAYEVVINEIYDDPTPSLGLPLSEYMELRIQTADGNSINLGDLMIRSFATDVALPAIEVQSNSHLILCDPSDSVALDIYGLVIPVEGFPTLLNTGNDLEVRTVAGKVLHKLSYNDSWYGDNSKDNGGWSLELINPENACALQTNWAASNSLIGGTPGQPNSVLNLEHETHALEVFGVVPMRPDRILVNFNKAISSVGFANFDLKGGDSEVRAAATIGRNLEQALLIVEPPLQQGVSYQLTVSNIDDCLSRPFDPVTLQVVIPQQPQPGDIIINEILFNPEIGGVDFIEIFNKSNKSFQIQDLAFGNINDQGQQLRPIVTPAILSPGAYFVFTPDPSDIALRYPPVNEKAIFRNLIPTLPDQFGNVTLIFQADGMPRIIDAFDYAETYHSRLLRDREGVSLERINPDGATQDPANWHSAASIAGHATPTNLNSQQRDAGRVEQMFTLSPARISPDGDGFEDFLTIDYQLPSTGYVAHVRIFDAAGRLARYLINNESLATMGQIKWDGETDDGRKTPIGIYTILIETVDPDGDSIRQKELCVVAGKLN